MQLASWHRWRDLFELAHLLVVDRPGAAVDADALAQQAPEVHAEIAPRWRDPVQFAETAHGGIAQVPMPALRPESSTELRRRIHDGESWQDWVPRAVAAYIVRHGLYQPATAIIPTLSTSDKP